MRDLNFDDGIPLVIEYACRRDTVVIVHIGRPSRSIPFTRTVCTPFAWCYGPTMLGESGVLKGPMSTRAFTCWVHLYLGTTIRRKPRRTPEITELGYP